MEYNIKINISEIIEFAPDEEKEYLFRNILFDKMSYESRVKSIKWLLNDMLECELEFDKRDKLIKAYETVINSIQ